MSTPRQCPQIYPTPLYDNRPCATTVCCVLREGHEGQHESSDSFEPKLKWEGVAAPLEPSQLESEARKFRIIDKGFRDGTMLSGTWIDKIMAEFAAAVSKNLQQQLDQANFSKKMWHDLSKEWEEICRQYPARILELEKEITALRETK